MLDRNYHWHCPKVNYGGAKIEEARTKYGVDWDDWKWNVIKKVEADTPEELEMKLKHEEAKCIIAYNSVDNGFNSNYGLKKYLVGESQCVTGIAC